MKVIGGCSAKVMQILQSGASYEPAGVFWVILYIIKKLLPGFGFVAARAVEARGDTEGGRGQVLDFPATAPQDAH